jgi:Ion transport protein
MSIDERFFSHRGFSRIRRYRQRDTVSVHDRVRDTSSHGGICALQVCRCVRACMCMYACMYMYMYIYISQRSYDAFNVSFLSHRLADVLPEDDPTEDDEKPDPVIPWYQQIVLYVIQYKNVIDIATIVPFYIFFSSAQGASFNFIRVLRLTRILHIFKLTKDNRKLRFSFSARYEDLF